VSAREPTVVHVHHHDIEHHAESFNEGFETAVAQGLADDPTLAQEWLAERLAQERAAALGEAADEAEAIDADAQHAAAVAPVPGEHGRREVVDRAVDLHDEPWAWLRARAEAERTGGGA